MFPYDEERRNVLRTEDAKEEALETLALMQRSSEEELQKILAVLRYHTVDRIGGLDMNALQYHAKALVKTAEVFQFLRNVDIVENLPLLLEDLEIRSTSSRISVKSAPARVTARKREASIGKSSSNESVSTATTTASMKKYVPPAFRKRSRCSW
ncbi:hypothetical protein L596_020248 [Steinernema carpocapsae]|uniref:Uncharacterized protein n=1 Tax=Steinernema carpocapsae TaxID=34508 RepID=A0A4U5MT63_STECR|nr:hypothetical protein L596_020248 [Steinernema carpocapsae]